MRRSFTRVEKEEEKVNEGRERKRVKRWRLEK